MSALFLFFALAAAPVKANSAEVRMIQHRYGDCVTQQNPREARDFVLNYRDSKINTPTGVLIDKLSDGRCLLKATDNYGGRMRLPGDSMRYALADSLIRRELLTAAPPTPASIAPLTHRTVDAAAIMAAPVGFGGKEAQLERERRLAMAQAIAAMSELGECIVRRSPTESLQLFRTAPGSAEEGAAFAALNPAIGQCVAAGSTVELTKVSLRGTIAVNYYRLANAPKMVAAAAGSVR